jgi:hypothetical protein
MIGLRNSMMPAGGIDNKHCHGDDLCVKSHGQLLVWYTDFMALPIDIANRQAMIHTL